MSSGFISEIEIEERRKTRQAEWEKVRKPDQPIEVPEEEYDNRTLFERLEEQRQKKDMEYEETHKLKNMIRGLDDDEIEFLDMVDRTKMEQEKRLKMEEAKELREYRNKVSALKEKQSMSNDLEEESKDFNILNQPFSSEKIPQNEVLASILKKRRNSNPGSPFPTKKASLEKPVSANSSCDLNLENSDSKIVLSVCQSSDNAGTSRHVLPSAMKCVGVLPGIGSYISDDSSDSERTSGSDFEDGVYDLKGHQLKKEVKPS